MITSTTGSALQSPGFAAVPIEKKKKRRLEQGGLGMRTRPHAEADPSRSGTAMGYAGSLAASHGRLATDG